MIKSQTMNNFMFDWPCGGDAVEMWNLIERSGGTFKNNCGEKRKDVDGSRRDGPKGLLRFRC